MKNTCLPNTNQGYMVGDYQSTSFVGALAFPAIEVAHAPSGSQFDEATYTVAGGLNPIAAGSGQPATQSGANSTSSSSASSSNR